jgi:hypothetical protein
MSDPHSIDGSVFTDPDADGSPHDEESLSLADATGDLRSERAGQQGDSGGDGRRSCAACGARSRLSALTRIGVRDDAGLSHAALCAECARDAVRPPDCALCRVADGADYPVTRIRDSEPLGAVCRDCRDGLCGRQQPR